MAAQTEHVKVREAEIAALEARISGYRKGFNRHKAKRDELHDKRKYTYILSSVGFVNLGCAMVLYQTGTGKLEILEIISNV